jgi:cytochrome oxidase Cu insertion factor (SCO1/SenC/PrrC family)
MKNNLFALLALLFLAVFIDTLQAEEKLAGSELIKSQFSLVNHLGEPVSAKDYHGKYVLVFFGFTHCPKVCPLGLHTMTSAFNKLVDLTEQLVPIFISVDPERDNIERMASYVKIYSPRLIGLTGSPAQIEEATRSFRAYYGRVKGATAQGYSFDHSSIIYLINKNGAYLAHFSSSQGADIIAEQIREKINADRASVN